MNTPTNSEALPHTTGSAQKRVGRTYRKCPWLNRKTGEEMHGIQVKLNGFQVRWMHCCEGQNPLIFKTPEERDAKLKEIRREERILQNVTVDTTAEAPTKADL